MSIHQETIDRLIGCTKKDIHDSKCMHLKSFLKPIRNPGRKNTCVITTNNLDTESMIYETALLIIQTILAKMHAFSHLSRGVDHSNPGLTQPPMETRIAVCRQVANTPEMHAFSEVLCE